MYLEKLLLHLSIHNIVCMKKDEFQYIDLSETFKSRDIDKEEYILIIQEGEIRKAVLLYMPRYRRFMRRMKYYKRLNFN